MIVIDEKLKLEDMIAEDPSLKLDFIGYTYCPLKHTFKECFEEVLKDYVKKTGDTGFKYYVPSGCSSENPYDDLWESETIDQLPEVIAGAGFGDFFRQDFFDRFISKGYFKAIQYQGIHKEFSDAGLVDPKGWYTVYSVFPLVMLVDIKKLGELPMPRKWSDLLNPFYKDNIVIGASHGDIHEELLLHIYKEHGEAGLISLASNVKTGWHASQMAKAAGSANSSGAAVYVIPWMFAKSCPRTEATGVVWPQDGALVTPMYILVKEAASEKYKPFIDFLTGSFYGKKSADNYFPAANSEVDNKLPEGAAFKWLGWDYIRSQPLEQLTDSVLGIFKKNWHGSYEAGGVVK